MAKQTKATIDKRVAALTGLSFTKDDEGKRYSHGNTHVTFDQIENESAGIWRVLMEKLEDDQIPFAEEVKDGAPAESHEVVLARTISTEVAKLDTNMEQIKKWKKQYGKLAVIDLNDKEGIAKVEEAKKILRKARTKVDAKHKEVKADYLQITQALDKQKKVYKDAIAEIEEPVDEWLKKIEAWEQEEATRIERENKEKLDGRVKQLIEAGMVFNGSWYEIAAITQDISSIEAYSDEEYTGLLDRVVSEKARLDKEAADDAEKKRLEDEKAAADKQKFIDDQKKLDEDNAKLAKEKEDMARERLQLRDERLLSIGLEFHPALMSYHFQNNFGKVSLTKSDLEAMENDAFKAFIETNKTLIAAAKESQKDADTAAEVLKKRTDARIAQMIELSFLFSSARDDGRGVYFMPDAEHIFMPMQMINTMTDAQWESEHAAVSDAATKERQRLADEAKKTEDARIAAEAIYDERKGILLDLGMRTIPGAPGFRLTNEFDEVYEFTATEVKTMSADEWGIFVEEVKAGIQRLADSATRQREDLEAKRQAALPEVDKINEYVRLIKAVPVPAINDEVLKVVFEAFNRNVDDDTEHLIHALNDWKEKNGVK